MGLIVGESVEDRVKSPFDAKRNCGAWLIGLLLGLIGPWLAGGGAWLLSLGGSSYFAMAGLGCLLAAFFYLRQRRTPGMATYLVVFTGTCIWAAATNCWAQRWQTI